MADGRELAEWTRGASLTSALSSSISGGGTLDPYKLIPARLRPEKPIKKKSAEQIKHETNMALNLIAIGLGAGSRRF